MNMSMKLTPEWYQNELAKVGIHLEILTGHLFYTKTFEPLNLNYELIFIRHGETFGNCGQISSEGKIIHKLVDDNVKNYQNRIFQGCVDEEINQLTSIGKKQAEDLAISIEKRLLSKGWIPDAIFHSPLSRAKDTGLPFISRNNLWDSYHRLEEIKEMSFGCWDNRRLCDFSRENECHLFYKNQNSLVMKSGTNGNGRYQEGENFCDVILRARKVLLELNEKCSRKKIMMFSHSMFGAACCILRGKGQQVENNHYLAFDGKRQNGSSFVLPHTTPISL